MLEVTDVHPTGEYRLRVRFSDGLEGEVDLKDALEGAVFAPLRDHALFTAARVDPEVRTVAWPNGADLAPEFLRSLLTRHPLP